MPTTIVTSFLIFQTLILVSDGLLARKSLDQLRNEYTEPLPVSQLSPGFLGMYRKLMEIEDEVLKYTDRYRLDFDLARAICLYESGGNANLTSVAGAQGYFQVMPATFRSLRVETNIEAGVKYISQLVNQFDREDYAVAAYNAGPGRVARARPMPLATLQYVLGVGHYRTILKLYEPSIRHHVRQFNLAVVGKDENWWTVAQRLERPLLELRLHNPFLSYRHLRPGQLIAYPDKSREDLLIPVERPVEYVARLGDNYFNIADAFDVDLNELREKNDLWRLQNLPAGKRLKIPLDWEGKHTVHRVRFNDTIQNIAEELESEPWRIIRDNELWEENISEGMALRVRSVPPKPTYVTYRVAPGDTLTAIARRYRTTISAIQMANEMGRRTLIRIGQNLRVPSQGN